MVGGLGVVACGSSTTSGSSSPTTAATPNATTAPTPTTAPPPKGAKADVTITKCAPSSNEFLGAEATLSITNHSSKTSNYLITVAFDSPDGATQLDTGNAAVQNLAPSQTTTETASSLKSETRSQHFVCKVADVTRYASG
jgi:hypothetical protein